MKTVLSSEVVKIIPVYRRFDFDETLESCTRGRSKMLMNHSTVCFGSFVQKKHLFKKMDYCITEVIYEFNMGCQITQNVKIQL